MRDWDSLYALCLRENYFTKGSISQLNKLKLMWEDDINFSLEDCAVVIWVCSDGCSLSDIESVLNRLRKVFNLKGSSKIRDYSNFLSSLISKEIGIMGV